ncbi:von Willebrand factor type A domain-containing protein [Flavobacterium sp.]|uniref:YfbK domain-containing protein n=1 Tax=Flavobacterium sp. TaxID=239 RepID=UPI0026382E7C|nr:von Willebrand factor type A domain-containing protein [Flavobacterium sp.]
MKSLKLISSAIAMLICFVTFAQEKNITGTVTDKNGALPGAAIVVKGTTNGVSTDINGKYSIKAKSGDILVFSYIGYQTKGVTVGNSNTINVVLIELSNQLQEVVVVGSSGGNAIYSDDNNIKSTLKPSENLEFNFDKSDKSTVLNEVVVGAMGIKRTKDATVSAQKTISSRELTQASNPSVLQSLNGKVSGLQVNAISNGVNGETRVILRGNRSITGNNQALIVIDNVISSTEVLNQLSPNVIDNVNVIKGAQGSALYGSQGVNGVIVVTTKKGYNNKTVKEPEYIYEEEPKLEKAKSKKIEIDQEEYENFIENQFESPKSAPLSTFSIDVDNASYTNIRRFINNGQTVPKDAVRVEEMINFFKYNYPQPQNEHPFSINTDYNECPWNNKNKIVRIGLQGKNIETKDLPNSNLTFLIDVSGSMNDVNKLPLLKESLKILVNQLRKEDRISIVVYAGAAGLVLPSTSGNDKEKIINSLDKLNAGGSTAGGAGIELAYKIAQENFIKGGNNRVILATDGDFNVGSSSNTDMQTLIEEKRKSGVFLTCLGYGMGNYKDSKMEILADKGNGNYAYIDNIQEANRFLGKEFKGSMFAIAKDVKIQIEFNPSLVQAYRLIGYENRKLRPEDFKNDAIDAGELGSGHTVTALYEIIPTGVKNEMYQEPSDLKYTKSDTSNTDFKNELATIKFRYKKPDGDKSIEMISQISNKHGDFYTIDADFKFSIAVAWFGLKLRNSKLVTNKSSLDIIALAKEGLINDTDGYRSEFIRLVESVK